MSSQRKLVLAGMAAAGAIALSAVSLCIAVIAGLRPPVSGYLTAEQNADEAHHIRMLWIPPAICLVAATLALLQALMRRPMAFSRKTYAPGAATPSVPWLILLPVGVGLFFAVRGLTTSLSAIQAIAPRPMTDSPALSGLAFPFGTFGLFLFILSGLVFANWWTTAGCRERAAIA